MNNVIITGTKLRQCAPSESVALCRRFGGGNGIGAYGGASIGIEYFIVADNSMCGAQISYGSDSASGGLINLRDGIVSRNEICGVNIQTQNFEMSQVTDDVIYFDNNYNNLDINSIPTPDISQGITF